MLIKITPFVQETPAYCGPTVIQTLLDYIGIKVSQNQVVAAALAKSRVMSKGIRPDQLAKAIPKLAPNMEFWLKQNATASDLDQLINTYHYPVAVDWQGLFYDSVEEEKKVHPLGYDSGHYSTVIGVDRQKDSIVIYDQYPDFAKKPRKFSLNWFVTRRWWDVVYEKDKKTGKKIGLYTKHLIFIIVPKSATFPQKLHFSLVDDFAYLNHK